MNITEIAKRSLHTLWAQKHLWFFGFFVAAAGGGGGSSAESTGAASGGGFPAWLVPVVLGLSIAGLVMLVLHVLSEAALIRGVRDEQEGETLGILGGLKSGRRHFFTVLGLKLLLAFGFVVAGIVMVAPLALGAFEVMPMLMAALLAIPLIVMSIPFVLTLYFVYEYALRFAVLDDLGARDAIAASRRFLHGRLADSIRLTLLSFAGQVGGSLLSMIATLPGALIGLGLYFTLGLVPAIVVGALLIVPALVLVQGAMGTFRSSVWTLGFLSGRV